MPQVVIHAFSVDGGVAVPGLLGMALPHALPCRVQGIQPKGSLFLTHVRAPAWAHGRSHSSPESLQDGGVWVVPGPFWPDVSLSGSIPPLPFQRPSVLKHCAGRLACLPPSLTVGAGMEAAPPQGGPDPLPAFTECAPPRPSARMKTERRQSPGLQRTQSLQGVGDKHKSSV